MIMHELSTGQRFRIMQYLAYSSDMSMSIGRGRSSLSQIKTCELRPEDSKPSPKKRRAKFKNKTSKKN
jgi:hypothetical protein